MGEGQKTILTAQPAACGALIRQIHNQLERRTNNLLRNWGLTISQANVLLELHLAPEQKLTIRELEQRLHVAQSTVTGIVFRLERKGLLQEMAGANRRIKLLRMTPSGEALCHLADRYLMESELLLLKGLAERERILLHELLEQAARNLEGERQHSEHREGCSCQS